MNVLQSFDLSRHKLAILIALSAGILVLIPAHLHESWVWIPWLIAIGAWAWFWSNEKREAAENSTFGPEACVSLLVVLTAAAAALLVRLNDFPIGPFADEIFNLNDSLLLSEKRFDLFGQTPLISDGWIEMPNLYLYFNLLILKLFGVSYSSMKLLSVIPGVICCGAFFLIAHRIFTIRIAIGTAALFTFGHWSLRLGRYGWAVSFMIMMFTVAIWLLLRALQSGRPLYAYCSGIAAGIALYSCVGAQVAVASLVAFLILEYMFRRDRSTLTHGVAFATAIASVAYPIACYYVSRPGVFSVRTSELSVFNSTNPLPLILKSVGLHALMFHWKGGTFARDNFPGLPMLDPLTGLVLIAGLVILIQMIKVPFARLIACTFVLNFAGGVFSVSQEAPPYVFRTASVIVPAFIIVGLGLQWLMRWIGTRWILVWCALTIAINLYLYFGLEMKNSAAMRVMAYESRLVGLEIARDDAPVWLGVPDVLSQVELRAAPGEKYANANPAVVIEPAVRKLAIIDFSGRYDSQKPVSENYARPKMIYFVDSAKLESNDLPIRAPAKIIFRSSNERMNQAFRQRGASLRYISDINGQPLLTVASFAAPGDKHFE
jgi:Dolichyl-phosphate-mannose-protein mannosyltransferase